MSIQDISGVEIEQLSMPAGHVVSLPLLSTHMGVGEGS